MITIDQKLADFLLNNEKLNPNGWPLGNLILCVIALILCVALVGIIGIERERRGRSAGLRTHLLVGVGSTIIMIISIYGFPALFGNRDVARLAAQIITGVGFLGAGAIIHHNSDIRGLTTAGTIWASMAIGIACGSFNFIIALMGTGLIFAVLTIFRKVEVKVNKKNPAILLIADATKPALYKIAEVSKRFNCTTHGMSSTIKESGGSKLVEITFHCLFQDKGERMTEYLAALEKETEALSVQLLGHM